VTFSEIQGQDKALRILQKDLEKGNLYGAYLFVGPAGVGKKLAAINFAKALNCKESKIDGCNRCSSCIRINKMSHPNLRILSPKEESFKIEQIRQLKSNVGYKIFEGKKKVWIMDEAEKLTPEAANSLLKILEEPPPDHIIILITHAPHLLPSTIISRCRVVNFLPLKNKDICKLLQKRGDTPPHLIPLVSQLAQGSISEALKLIKEKDIFEERERILKLIQKGKKAPQEIFELSKRWHTKQSSHLETLLNMILFFLRDLLLLKLNISFPLINQDKIDKLRKLKEDYTFSQLYRGIEAIEQAKMYLNANVSPQLVLEEVWLKIFYPEKNY